MSNYKSLKEEEKNILERFKLFLNSVIQYYEKQIGLFTQCNVTVEMFDESIEIDRMNIRKARDILDDCVWFIQKNEPRANHLRLIIAIINSLNDIKRMSNYIVSFSKFYDKQKNEVGDETILEKIHVLAELSLSTMKSLYTLIDDFDLASMSQEANNIFLSFIEKYKEHYTTSIKESILKKNDDVKYVAKTVIVIKNFDRFVDHMMNIIENLMTIA